jgi:hypothetical protein
MQASSHYLEVSLMLENMVHSINNIGLNDNLRRMVQFQVTE